MRNARIDTAASAVLRVEQKQAPWRRVESLPFNTPCGTCGTYVAVSDVSLVTVVPSRPGTPQKNTLKKPWGAKQLLFPAELCPIMGPLPSSGALQPANQQFSTSGDKSCIWWLELPIDDCIAMPFWRFRLKERGLRSARQLFDIQEIAWIIWNRPENPSRPPLALAFSVKKNDQAR